MKRARLGGRVSPEFPVKIGGNRLRSSRVKPVCKSVPGRGFSTGELQAITEKSTVDGVSDERIFVRNSGGNPRGEPG